ncbi:MAG: RuvC [uncultured Thermomicrobiales bacterium]|uniref:Crossover junction endodeoxyribonuclease RuvC n=1 Tax=uncultured Thermomicrobiales bacterium TaxID=1645740 RepID=A0A6J4UG79_9BACT|nr:MAG: RuvC [uncultured Thermomicrobiales bacterium]
MIVLGVDPGTALLGFGIIEDGPRPVLRDFGALATEPGAPMPDRLSYLFDAVTGLIRDHRPEILAIEQLFFARNVTTAIAVGQARGVVLLAAARSGVTVAEYSPSEVKHAIAGYGKADKKQMQEMVRIILGLDAIPRPDDAADALAIALCHAQTAPFLARTGQTG